MARYRRKPVEVEAVQWAGEITPEMDELIPAGWVLLGEDLLVDTPLLPLRLRPGDWLVRGPEGLYAPAAFEADYEPVE